MAKQTRAERIDALAGEHREKLRSIAWWLDEEPHLKVFDVGKRVDRHLERRRRRFLEYACLYDDSELATLIAGSSAFYGESPEALTTNIVRRQVDTYTAKVSKNRPAPFCLTSGGNYSQQRRARQLTKAFEGVLDSTGYYATRALRIRDSAIFGSGFAHNYRLGDKLVHERVYPWELAVDPREAKYGKPRSLYKVRLVDKFVLLKLFPKFEEEIMQAESRSPHDLIDASEDTSHLAVVREAWHLPSVDGADDGMHAICISNATLKKRPYARDYFPFSKLDFSPPLVGWFGEGMVKFLEPVQSELNEIAMRLQEMAYLTGSYVWVPDGSGIETDTLDNGALTLVKSALEPKFITPPPWHPQFFDYFQKLRTEMPPEITGISGLATRGEIPAGLESGKAIRAYHQIDAENLLPQGRLDEDDCIQTCWQLFDLMEEIHGEKGGAYVISTESRGHGRSTVDDIDYAKVRLDKKALKIRTFPISFLSSTPEERWSQLKEMAESGLFPQEDIATLMEFPDVERVFSMRGAPRRVVEKIIERILDAEDPKPPMPEPMMNLDLCVALGTLAYLEAKFIDEAPEKNTQALLEFVLNAREMRDTTGGPQAGAQSPDALPPDAGAPLPPDAGMPPPGVDPTYIPPGAPPLPAGAVAPDVLPPMQV